jgi:beta-lactamase regulating signal transducer with metallopeptidase domain
MIAWGVEAMLIASLMMLLVLGVRKPVAELFGAESAYALWLLPLLVPLLPPLPALTPLSAVPLTIIIPAVPVESMAAAEAPSSGASADWLFLLLSIWAGGAAVFAIWQQSTYSAFLLHLGPEGRRGVPPSYGGIKVVESDAVEGPVAVGLLNRRIVVPLDFATRYSPAEQRLALEHELIHHRRFDLLANWLALGILTLNWFNPIAHFAFRAFRADQELACDAAVTRRCPAERHDYARALVKSASQPGLIAACPLNHADMLKRRLKMMKRHGAGWTRRLGGAVTIALLGTGGLTLSSPGAAHREDVQVVVNEAGPNPVIAKADMAKLEQKCGSGGGAIVCEGEAAKDPEVRAIVQKGIRKAALRLPPAKPDLGDVSPLVDLSEVPGVELASLALPRARLPHHLVLAPPPPPPPAVPPGRYRYSHGHVGAGAPLPHPHVIKVERDRHARKAAEHVRAQLARLDVNRVREAALKSALASAASKADRSMLAGEFKIQVETSLRAVRREIEKGKFSEDAEEVEAELERELERFED